MVKNIESRFRNQRQGTFLDPISQGLENFSQQLTLRGPTSTQGVTQQNGRQKIWVERLFDSFEKLREAAPGVKEAVTGIGQAIGNTFSTLVQTGQLRLRELLASLARFIAEFAAFKLIIEPLQKRSSFLGQAGGFVAGLLRKIPIFGDGGAIAAGQLGIVGDRGPELFVPRANGHIVPNHLMGAALAGGGAMTVNHNWTVNAIDTQGFDQLLAQRAPFLKNLSVAAVQEAFNKRGNYGPLDKR